MKKLVLAFMIIFLIISGVVVANKSISIPELYRQHISNAEKLTDRELYVNALEEYDKALAIKGGDYDILLAKTHLYYLLGDTSRYIRSLDELTTKHYDKENAYVDLINYYLESNNYRKAIPVLYKGLHYSSENNQLLAIKQELNGLHQIIHTSFNHIGNFNDSGTAIVKVGEKYGFMDEEGTAFIYPTYNQVTGFDSVSGLAAVNIDGSWHYIDRNENKKMVSDLNFEYLGIFSLGMAPAKLDGKYHYINYDFNTTINHWEETTPFINGVAAVKLNGEWAILNQKFNYESERRWDDIKRTEEGFAFINRVAFAKKGQKYELISTKGEPIVSTSFDDAKAFEDESLAAVKMGEKWGYINSSGEMVIEAQFEDAKSFANGYAAVSKAGLWGYIDTTGKYVIDPSFIEANHFYKSGVASVLIDGGWKLIELQLLKYKQ